MKFIDPNLLRIKDVIYRYLRYSNKEFSPRGKASFTRDILNINDLLNERQGYFLCYEGDPFNLVKFEDRREFLKTMKVLINAKTLYFVKDMKEEIIFKLPPIFKDGYVQRNLLIYNNKVLKKKKIDEIISK